MTETLLAWGITPVACTRFCEQPALTHVGGTKDPAIEAIVELHPDMVIVDAEENRVEDHDALVDAGLHVHALRVRSVADVAAQLLPLAESLGVSWAPPTICSLAPMSAKVFVPIWKRPWMALGTPTYGSSMLAELGLANAFEGAGAYPETTLEEAAGRGATVVIAPSEPYPFGERHRSLLEAVGPTHFVDGRDLLWWGARTGPALERLARILA